MRGKNLFLNMHTITNITWIFNFTFSEKQLIHPKKFFAIEHAERKSNVRPVSSQLQTTNWFPSGLLTMQMKPFLSCKKKNISPLCVTGTHGEMKQQGIHVCCHSTPRRCSRSTHLVKAESSLAKWACEDFFIYFLIIGGREGIQQLTFPLEWK